MVDLNFNILPFLIEILVISFENHTEIFCGYISHTISAIESDTVNLSKPMDLTVSLFSQKGVNALGVFFIIIFPDVNVRATEKYPFRSPMVGHEFIACLTVGELVGSPYLFRSPVVYGQD